MSDDLTIVAKLSYQFLMAVRGSQEITVKPRQSLWGESTYQFRGNDLPEDIYSKIKKIEDVENIKALGPNPEGGQFANYLIESVASWNDQLKIDVISIAEYFAEAGVQIEGWPDRQISADKKKSLKEFAPNLARLVA